VAPDNRGARRWPRRLLASAAVGLVAAVATVIGLGAPAQAHGQFVSSDPAAGAVVTAPVDAILIYFTEKPTSNAYFAVTSPDGARVDRLWSHGPTMPIDPEIHEWYHQPDGKWVVRAYRTAYAATVPIAYWPKQGEYTVQFLSVATDGEPVRGQFTFTYSGPTSDVPANFSPQRSQPDPNLLSIAATDAPTGPPTGPPIEEIVKQQSNGPGVWVVWLPVGIVAAVAVAVLVFWRARPQQAKEIMVSRFGGRYAAPAQRRPRAVPPGPAVRPAAGQRQLPGQPQQRTGTGTAVSDEPSDENGS
jgi:methionine-rich copper-binding protein CopC